MAPGSKGDVDDRKKLEGNAESEKDDNDLETLFEYIDEKHGFFINRLRDFVEFKTVSSDPSKKYEFPRMAEFMVGILKKFGIRSTVMNMIERTEGDGAIAEGDVVPLIIAETEIDPAKRTVLFYCHYDVYPVNYQECWVDPFELTMTQDDSELHGKGTSAGKGPLLCVINAIGAYRKMKKIPLPVNVKMILDPMGTADEDFTGKFLKRIDTDFFLNVDSVCLCTGRWLGNTRPCVSHGSRGICYFTVEVEGPSKDLHSGSYGGLLNEPLADLVYILNSLVDRHGVIRVTDMYDDVCPVTKEQKRFFKSIHFSVRDLQQEIGASELQVNEDKAAILTRLWCQPSLTIHGIQGGFSQPGTRNVIPGKVTGKFSINIVPNMTPSKVKKKVVDYLAKVWKARKSTNKIRVQMTVGKLFWYTDGSDMNVIAAKNAVAKAYNNEPDLIREPNRIRIASVLKRLTEAPVVMIPISKSNDISDSDSEKLDVLNYINGTKTFTAYMKYLAELFPRVQSSGSNCVCKVTGQLEFCKCYLQYIPPPEEEVDVQSQKDWSFSQMSLGANDPPEFKYYYLSLMAMKRMQKLQEIISISHLAPIVSTVSLAEAEAEAEEDRLSDASKPQRMALASFSVCDLHDESKPRIGGWLPKRSSAVKEEMKIPTLSNAEAPRIGPPESSTRIVPPGGQPFEPSTVALQPTVFSFRLAQSLKKNRAEPFDLGKRQVLQAISASSPNSGKNGVAESKSEGGIPATEPELTKAEQNEEAAAVNGESLQKLGGSSKSSPDLTTKSQKLRGDLSTPADVTSEVFHPNVNRSVHPKGVMSSTSRILYDKRLKKTQSESNESIKSLQMAPSSKKMVRHSPDLGSVKDPSVANTEGSSLSRLLNPESGTPGGPVKPSAVVSSMSDVLYKKRMAKEITESMTGLKSDQGDQEQTDSTKKIVSEPSSSPKVKSLSNPSAVGSVANSTGSQRAETAADTKQLTGYQNESQAASTNADSDDGPTEGAIIDK